MAQNDVVTKKQSRESIIRLLELLSEILNSINSDFDTKASINDLEALESRFNKIDMSGLSSDDSPNKYLVAWLRGQDATNPLKDECGNTWITISGGKPSLTSTNAIAGTNLQVNGVYELNDTTPSNPVYLGGQDFTIDGWLGDIANQTFAFHIWRTGESFNGLAGGLLGFDQWFDASTLKITWYIATGYSGGISDSPIAPFHFAYVYKHAEQKLNVFMNGVLTTIGNIEINRAAYNVQIGVTGKTFDQFRIYDGLARWDSNFNVPDIDDYALPFAKKIFITNGGKTYVVEAREAYLSEIINEN